MIGHTVVRLEEITSTNDFAKGIAGRPDADGIVVLAGRQTKGRGRLGRQWFSPPYAGIYMSIILKRPLHGKSPFLICPALSLALAETIEYFSDLKPLIKWPNDMILNGKKAAGILVEKTNDIFVAGIGINLNTELHEFPEEIKDKATSLKAESGMDWDREEFLKKLFLISDGVLSGLSDGDHGELLKKVKDRSFTLGKTVKITDGTRVFEGEALGFESDGSLLLKVADGKIINIRSGETE